INGTPTATGTFNYSVTTAGPCINPTLTGSITVTNNSTLGLSGNATPTLCINTALPAIQYGVGGGSTGATVTGLPAGLTGSYNTGVFTISGSPTAAGIFNYSVTTSGPCTNATLNGTITVNNNSTLSLSGGNATPTLCINTALPSITYTVGGG